MRSQAEWCGVTSREGEPRMRKLKVDDCAGYTGLTISVREYTELLRWRDEADTYRISLIGRMQQNRCLHTIQPRIRVSRHHRRRITVAS